MKLTLTFLTLAVGLVDQTLALPAVNGHMTSLAPGLSSLVRDRVSRAAPTFATDPLMIRSTESTSATASPLALAPGTGKKACIAYVGDHLDIVSFIGGSQKVGCIMNWSTWKPSWINQLPGVEFAPIFWGRKSIREVQNNVKPGFAKYILGFNEPNEGPSQMSVASAVQLWTEHMLPLKWQGYTLVSPACTNNPSGYTWISDFLNQCQDCHVDQIALHWYGTDGNDFIAHINQFRQFGRKMWVTEYACQDNSGANAHCNADQTWNFMEMTQSFMDNDDAILFYAWFGALDPWAMGGVNMVNLLKVEGTNGTPTPLGRKYLGI